MRPALEGEAIRKVKLVGVRMTVNTEAEPEDLHAAIADALPGAEVEDLRIVETFVTEQYGDEEAIGEDPPTSYPWGGGPGKYAQDMADARGVDTVEDLMPPREEDS